MGKKYIIFTLFLVAAFCLFAESIEDMLNTPIPSFETNRDDKLICRYTVERLQSTHYEHRQVTPAMSSKWFQEYFNNLDSLHILFRQSDIDYFRPYENVLWNQQEKSANTEFAFKVFNCYLQRLKERAVFEQTCLDSDFDFTVDETLKLERKDEPFPASVQEQHELWRKLAKNNVLLLKLDLEKAAQKAAKKAAGDNSSDDEDDVVEDEEDGKKARKSEQEEILELKKRSARQFKFRAELERTDVLQIFLNSLCDLYDPHTNYLSPEAQEDMDMHLALSLQGIGATLTTEDEYTKIVEVLEGSPAEKTGRLKKGDRIVAVAQEGKEPEDVLNMPLKKVVKRIRGKKGTKVTLTIMPEGSRDKYDVVITRDVIEMPDDAAKSSKHEIELSNGKKANVLVLYLPSFYTDFKARFAGDPNYRSTTRDMLALIKKENKDIDGIIIDMRGNGGGGLDEAINLSGLFFPLGYVVQKKDYSGVIEKMRDIDPETYFAGPLILMVDRHSASATEIMAAALQDMGRALVVGDKETHGKGTVQVTTDYKRIQERIPILNKHVSLPDLGGMKITIAKFYRINGGATQLKGVVPDIIFPSLLDNSKTSERDYDHALAWDEIQPVPYVKYKKVAQIKDGLRAKSEARIAANPDFQKYKEDIAFCKAFDDIKDVSLNIDKRRAYEADFDKVSKITKQFYKRGMNYYKPKKGKKEKVYKDFVLDETLNIMKDYIEAE